MDFFFQVFFLLLTAFKATELTLLRYNTREKIIIQHTNKLKIGFYLVEEMDMELWIFIIHNHSPTRVILKQEHLKEMY